MWAVHTACQLLSPLKASAPSPEPGASVLQAEALLIGLWRGSHLSPASSGAFAKVKESQRMSDEGRMDQEEADGIRKRCRVVGFALQAEMNHFHERRVADFKRMMQSYLKQQIIFYQRVSQQLEKTLRMYDNL